MKKNKQAFTLVELIVVITILAILGTIAFITLQGYSAQARDSKRLSDIQNIKKSLEFFSLNTGKYPLPDNGEEIEYEGDLVWTQGIVGEKVIKNLSKNLSELPLDPKSELEYTYSLINSGNKYEVLSIYESDLVSQNKLINSSFASSNYIRVDGTYNGIFVKTSGYYIPTPSLITSENISGGLSLNGENIKSQIISGGKNKLTVGLSESSTGELNIKLVAFTGSITSKSEDSEKQKLAEIIQEAYTGGSLANVGVYKEILETTELEDLVNLVDNVVLNNANVSGASKDTEAPTGGDFSMPNTTNSVNVELIITCPEEEGTEIYISGNIVGTSSWETCVSSKNVELINENGSKNISVKWRDSVGNESGEVTKSIEFSSLAFNEVFNYIKTNWGKNNLVKCGTSSDNKAIITNCMKLNPNGHRIIYGKKGNGGIAIGDKITGSNTEGTNSTNSIYVSVYDGNNIYNNLTSSIIRRHNGISNSTSRNWWNHQGNLTTLSTEISGSYAISTAGSNQGDYYWGVNISGKGPTDNTYDIMTYSKGFIHTTGVTDTRYNVLSPNQHSALATLGFPNTGFANNACTTSIQSYLCTNHVNVREFDLVEFWIVN